jgi:hypothetical protein
MPHPLERTRLLLTLMLVCFLGATPLRAQGTAGSTSRVHLLVLQDGREFGIDGPYRVVGDQVEFNAGGHFQSIAIKKVDLERSRLRNEEIQKARAQAAQTLPQDDSLASRIIRDQAKRNQSNTAQPFSTQMEVPQPPVSAPATKPPTGVDPPPGLQNQQPAAKGLAMWQDMGNAKNLEELNRQLTTMLERVDLPVSLLLTALILLMIAGLVGFISEIVLIVSGFGESILWGVVLLAFFLGTFFVPLFSGFLLMESGNPMAMIWLSSGFQLLKFATFLLFIVLAYPGARLRIFFFWTLPFWMSLGLGLGIALKLLLSH